MTSLNFQPEVAAREHARALEGVEALRVLEVVAGEERDDDEPRPVRQHVLLEQAPLLAGAEARGAVVADARAETLAQQRRPRVLDRQRQGVRERVAERRHVEIRRRRVVAEAFRVGRERERVRRVAYQVGREETHAHDVAVLPLAGGAHVRGEARAVARRVLPAGIGPSLAQVAPGHRDPGRQAPAHRTQADLEHGQAECRCDGERQTAQDGRGDANARMHAAAPGSATARAGPRGR